MSFSQLINKTKDKSVGAIASTITALEAALGLPPASRETRDIANEYRQSPQAAYEQAWPGCEVVADDVLSEDGAYVIGTIAQVRSDNSELLLGRDALLSVISKVIEKQYPELKMALGKIIPIDDTAEGVVYGFSGTEIFEIVQLDYIGSMAIISDYSKGGPASDVVASRAYVTVKFFGGQVNFSLFEILRVISAGQSLPDMKLQALKRSYLKYLNAVGYFGDVAGGLQGLLTISGTTNYIVPTPVSFGVNADYLTSLLASIASTIPEITNGIENPTKLVTPLRLRDIAMATHRHGVDKTVYEEFLDRERLAGRITEWITDEILMTARNGKAVCLVLHDEKDKLCLKVPQGFSLLDAQLNHYAYTIHGFGSTAGVFCTAPASIMIVEGIFG